jgi:hypothetical protein
MKIYMEQTINLMIDENPTETLAFFKDAELCETKSGLQYYKK